MLHVRWTLALAAVTLLVAETAGPLLAQEKYPGPDAPATQLAARRALPGVMRPITGRVVAIVGMTRGLEAVLEELGARVTAQEIRIDLAADVLFDFDKADLKPAAVTELGKVAQVIAGHAGAPIRIAGHTDSKGNDAYNLRLSERRAAAVATWLTANAGVAANQVETEGRGEVEPVAPNATPDGRDDPEGRQKNRRVEITIRTGGR